MTKSKQQTQKLIVDAFKLWMGGKGRSELAEATGLGRAALRAAFVKLSKKTWSQLNADSGRTKPKARKAAAK